MDIDISVVVPTYNRAGLIGETIDSILSQSYKPREIIVVDDGSTDATESVVARYQHAVKYLRILNSGECRARNVGVDATSSDWIAFCDSDDLWHPDKLLIQANLLAAATDVKYSFTNFKTVVDGVWSTATKFDTSPPGYWDMPRQQIGSHGYIVENPICERLLVHQPIFPSTLMMHRSFFEFVGRWCEPLGHTPSVDLEFHFRCTAHARIGVVTTPVVGIRKHDGNISGDNTKMTIGEIVIRRYLLEHNEVAQRVSGAIHSQINQRTMSAAEGLFGLGHFEEAHQLFHSVPYRDLSLKMHVKNIVAQLPDSFRSTVLAMIPKR